ncbi:MAG: purine-nucleoside phosphorylase [Deltaproteobacteria bacterium]|jgi:purine-nucleoside phosphorylase|nr:purine-nucleoside phosphorylase [Deltaproteobacteria bacterium]MBW2520805.1 purine-nucleoside phosphorylase [Deltaproteobacteria bacterium]
MSSQNFSQAKLVETVQHDVGKEPMDLAIVLGSGWSPNSLGLTPLGQYEYADWDYFPKGQIKGHSGKFLVARIGGWRVLVFCGRFHCYQGLNAFDVTCHVRLARELGCHRLLLTCATGGINPNLSPGDVLMVEDHINLLGVNPLYGLKDDVFIDLSTLYSTELYPALKAAAADMPCSVHRGVLAAMPGPSYETPAEIRMLSALGADVVSMSIVPEAIMGRYLLMEVVALALVTNAAAGMSDGPISHDDVLATGAVSQVCLGTLLMNLVSGWQVRA